MKSAGLHRWDRVRHGSGASRPPCGGHVVAFSHAQAEAVLAGLFGADERVQKAAFRGRLKHLKRLGVPLGSRPGRGSKIDYELEHIYQWA